MSDTPRIDAGMEKAREIERENAKLRKAALAAQRRVSKVPALISAACPEFAVRIVEELESENTKLREIVRAAYLDCLGKLTTEQQRQLGRDLATYGTKS